MKTNTSVLTFFILIFSVLSFNLNAQTLTTLETITPDARIYDAFDDKFVDELTVDNPALILYYNYYLDNAFYISELPVDKNEFLANLTSLDLDENVKISEINILKLKLDLNFEQQTYYRIGKSDRVMIFYSGIELNDKFNDYRESLGLLNQNIR